MHHQKYVRPEIALFSYTYSRISKTKPLQELAARSSDILDELIRLDSFDIAQDGCTNELCEGTANEHANEGLYRCLDCAKCGPFCSDCMVVNHKCAPLHIIEVRHFSSFNCFSSDKETAS